MRKRNWIGRSPRLKPVKNKNYLLLAAGALAALTACTKGYDARKGNYTQLDLRAAPADLRVPNLIGEEIEKLAATVSYAPVEVRLLEETPGALRHRNLQMVFAKGGGNLDLADYVDNSVASDFVFALAVPDFAHSVKAKLLFISNARPRQLGGVRYGADCDNILELSSYYRQTLSQSGLRVTTRRDLYVNLIVGSYVVFYETEGAWHLTQLTVFDSRREDMQCRSNSTAAAI